MPSRRRRPDDPRQPSLPFDVLDPAPSDVSPDGSVFLAVRPDAATAERIHAFAAAQKRRFGLRGGLRPPEILHVSLLGLGRYEALPSQVIDAASRAAATVRLPRFTVAFDRLLNLGRQAPRPLVLGGEEGVVGLTMLRDALVVALAEAGLDRSGGSQFLPHMTLLYDRMAIDQTFLDEPLTWTVRDFVLVHSLYGLSRYKILGRWALGERPAQAFKTAFADPD